jgi:hypothetical protein
MALHSLGADAVSMTGGQMGVRTDGGHTKARIQAIDVDRLRQELAAGRIIVAAGFQGVTEDGAITTLAGCHTASRPPKGAVCVRVIRSYRTWHAPGERCHVAPG